jgi:hypothetical protein
MDERMARQLLIRALMPAWLLLLCLPMTACLFPQDDRILDPDPVALNRRPRIVRENINPTLDFDLMKTGTGCGPYPFSFYVEDDDVADELRVKVYVDFNPQLVEYDSNGVPVRESNRPVQQQEYEKGLTRQRQEPTKFSFTPSRSGDPLNGADKLGRHVIWAVVGDGSIVGGQVIQPAGSSQPLPDGGLPDRRYTDDIQWTVFVEQGDCQ